MLYLNGKLLSKENYPEEYPKVLAELKALRDKYKKHSLVLKLNYKTVINPGSGKKEKPGSRLIPFEVIRMGDNGSEHWQYATMPPKLDAKTGKLVFAPNDRRKHLLTEKWTIDVQREPELAYFMLKLSNTVKKHRLMIEDKAEEALQAVSVKKRSSLMQGLIYLDESPISKEITGSEFKMRQIASSWGIPNAHDEDKLTYEQVQESLYMAVMRGEQEPDGKEKRGVEAFINETSSPHITKGRYVVRQALDKDVIYFDADSSMVKTYPNGDDFYPVPLTEKHRYFEYLCRNLVLDEKKMKQLEEAVLDIPVVQPKDIEQMSYDALVQACQERKIKTFGRKKDDLKKDLLEAIK